MILCEIEQMIHEPDSPEEDEELREFQRIEKEIRLNELRKALESIEHGKSVIGFTADDNRYHLNGNHQQANLEDEDSDHHTSPSPSGVPAIEADTTDSATAVLISDEDDDETTQLDAIKYHSTRQELLQNTNRAMPEYNGSSNSMDSGRRRQRPLTLYMPAPNESIDLIQHVVTLGHDVHSFTDFIKLTPTSCSGYLWKLCAKSERKWRKRYFHFDRINKVFFYFRKASHLEAGKSPRFGVYFDEIQDVYVDHTRTKPKKHKHVFVVNTSKTILVLSCYYPEVMRIWIDVVFTGAEGYLGIE